MEKKKWSTIKIVAFCILVLVLAAAVVTKLGFGW